MSNVVDFGKRLEKKKEEKKQDEVGPDELMVLLCPECESTEFNVTFDLEVICNDCDSEFPYMYLMMESAEPISLEELETLIDDKLEINIDPPLEDDE